MLNPNASGMKKGVPHFKLLWKIKAEKNVRSANIFTFKAENQGILPTIDQIRNEYVSILLKITETLSRGTKILILV